MYIELTSAANEKVKAAKKAVADGRGSGLMLIEGKKPVTDAFKNGVVPAMVFSSEKTAATDKMADAFDVFLVPPYIMEKICDTRTPQSLCMLAKRPAHGGSLKDGRYLLCESLQDPKNLGAVVRTADALGMSGVILSGSSADPYSPKATRGAMGSNLYLPVYELGLKDIASLKSRFKIFGAVLDEKARPIDETDLTGNIIVAVGNEGAGLTSELIALCDGAVYIPMKGRAQSLNASVAAALIMWEITKGAKR